MTTLLERIRNTMGKPIWFWTLLILFLINQAIIGLHLGIIRDDLVRLQFTFNATGFSEIVSAWGTEEWNILRVHFIPDNLHPLLYGGALVSAIAYFSNLNGLSAKANPLLLLGILAALGDWTENSIHGLIAFNQIGITQPAVFAAAAAAVFKWTLAAAAVITAGLLLLAYKTKTDKKTVVETEIEINASPKKIWDILTDLDSYHAWNPFVVKGKGRISATGQKIEVFAKAAGPLRLSFRPEVTVYQQYEQFAWFGNFGPSGLAAGEHSFVLEKLPGGRTRVIHREEFIGRLLIIAGKPIADKTRAGFTQMDQALKARAEA